MTEPPACDVLPACARGLSCPPPLFLKMLLLDLYQDHAQLATWDGVPPLLHTIRPLTVSYRPE